MDRLANVNPRSSRSRLLSAWIPCRTGPAALVLIRRHD